MRLIAGLGNPGRLYLDSRHNIGFTVVKALARNYRGSFKKEGGLTAVSARIKMAGGSVILALPLTFVNLSGIAVRDLLKKYRIDLASLLVICDDLNLELGRLKIRPSGSSGGHRGLESIIDILGSQNFSRLRLGIGRPLENSDPAEYVLSAFTKKEKEIVRQTINKAMACCEAWVTKGIAGSMNIFNKRSG
jgi:PTH1 family peptidyl-tRNA hydrolase